MERNLNPLAAAQAAGWYARLRAQDCGGADRQAFEAWLARDAGHADIYRQICELDERIAQLVPDKRMQALAAEALATAPRKAASSRPPAGWRVAAALVLAIAVTAFVGLRSAPDSAPAIFANAGTAQQRIQLSDGSVVHLDVGSRFTVRMSRSERRLELLEGRADFAVAHDAKRPFSVRAGGATTVALGTRFEVALGAQDVRVTLAEGTVAISDSANARRWREVLKPGQQLIVAATRGSRERREVDATTTLSWSSGRLVFNGVPLGKALEEINRYTRVKLRLGDRELEAVPIGGSFAAGGDSEQIADAIAAVIPLRTVRVGATDIVLYQRREMAVN